MTLRESIRLHGNDVPYRRTEWHESDYFIPWEGESDDFKPNGYEYCTGIGFGVGKEYPRSIWTVTFREAMIPSWELHPEASKILIREALKINGG